MLTFDLFLSPSGPQISDDSYFISFFFFFSFPYKETKRSEGLRKVVKILEELHIGYWEEKEKI